MKIALLTICMVLMVSMVYCADVSFPPSTDNELTVVLNNNANITAFNMSIDRVPTSFMNLTENKEVYMYQGNMVVYSLDDAVIPSGDVAQLIFDDIIAGRYTIKVTKIVATNGQAVDVAITGGDGIIAITFSPEMVHNTFISVVNPNVQGIDVNHDGTITVHDGQLAANNQ